MAKPSNRDKDIVWEKDEIQVYEKLRQQAKFVNE